MSNFIDTLREFKEACRSHDWYYQYSDDHGVWKRGQSQRSKINALFLLLKEHGLEEQANNILTEYKPEA